MSSLSYLETRIIKEKNAAVLTLQKDADERYICPAEGCGLTFKQIAEAGNHLQTLHKYGNNDGIWFCKYCPAVRSMDLEEVRCHIKEKHLCAFCKSVQEDKCVQHIRKQ